MIDKIGLNRPTTASFSEASVSFADLGISDAVLSILEKFKLTAPTPIQRKAIPTALSGHDLIGVAQTGTGKTYAFGIPILQRIGSTNRQALVIAPTRELALQVGESLQKLGQALNFRVAILIGGESFDRQLFCLRRDPQIVVVTPGRLIDHLQRRTFKLERVSILVLDEADMMLDMGFAPQIKEILDQAPLDRQTMLFSATMPAAIVKIAAKYMKLPVSIEVAPSGTTVEQVDQEIFIIKNEERLDYLQKILATYTGSVLIFVRTKHGVKALTQKLQSFGQRATEIHSNLSLNRRRAALNDFKTKRERILVATDVAARGLDVDDIELVVNYNLPDSCEDYVHRIGRTGRAGRPGKAISLATPAEQRMVYSIERLINKSIKKTEFTKFYAEPAPRHFGGSRRSSGGPRRYARRQPFSR
jgi:ATP-dependent RNA helicase RhlE